MYTVTSDKPLRRKRKQNIIMRYLITIGTTNRLKRNEFNFLFLATPICAVDKFVYKFTISRVHHLV